MKMRTRTLSPLVALSCALAVAPAPASVGARADAEAEIVVTLAPGEAIAGVAARYGAAPLERIEGTNIYRVNAPSARRTLRRMRGDRKIQGVDANEPVRRHQGSSFPFDAAAVVEPGESPDGLYRRQLTNGQLLDLGIDATEALVGGGGDVVVAVLDTGVDFSHPALRDHLWVNGGEVPGNGLDDDGNGYVDDVRGYDFLDDDADASETASGGPAAGHGTFIAGLVALAAPRVRILPVRVLGPGGDGSVFDAAEAIGYAARAGARVISMSFGTDGRAVPHVLKNAVRSASELGIVMVAAAGNDGAKAVAYPASDPSGRVISVGATDGMQRAGFSNFGGRVDLSAPGVALVSAYPGAYDDGSPRYARWSGTSFSTAVVAAACSQLLTAKSTAAPGEILDRLRNTGDAVDQSAKVGKRVNFLEAVGSAIQETATIPEVSIAASLTRTGGEPAAIGSTVLRSIGGAERVTAHMTTLEPGRQYSLFVTSRGEDVYVGHGWGDDLGNVHIAASKRPTSAQEYTLPVPIDTVEEVIIRVADGGPEVCRAAVRRDSPGVQVWAGVGLKVPAEGGPIPGAFGWAWYGAPAGGPHVFRVDAFGLADDAQYVLRVDGQEVARRPVPAGDDSSISFKFDSKSGLPAPMSPVTRAGRVELWLYDREGVEHLLVGGNLRGA